MSKIYLKGNIEKNWYWKVLIWKIRLKVSFWEASWRSILSLNFKTSCCNIMETCEHKCVSFFHHFKFSILVFILVLNYDVLTKYTKFVLFVGRKTKWIENGKFHHMFLKRWTLCFTVYKNHELKWWLGAQERKKIEFFVTFILSEGNVFNTCVLSK